MRKQLAVLGIVTAVGTTGVIGAGVANAATNTDSSTDPMSSLVSKIASKFNLNKDEVQRLFDEQRSARQTEREQEVKDELAQLVKDGKLTQDQADKLTAKRTELKKEREAVRTSGSTETRDAMKTEMDTRRTQLETWAKENGIDTTYLRFVFGGSHGRGGPGERGMHSSADTGN